MTPFPAVIESPKDPTTSMSPGLSLCTDDGTVLLLPPGPLTSQKNGTFGLIGD